jgi:hypothetical protein
MKEKKSPFKTVSKNLPFYPDLTNEQQEALYCSYVDETELGEDPDPKKHIPVYIIADVKTGEQLFITRSYAITKAIEAARKDFKSLENVVFRFEFLGKTKIKGDKPFNKFDTSYCSLEDYEAYMKAEEPVQRTKKG